MTEIGMKKWVTSEIDRALAKELAAECEVDPIVALIASSRGYTDPASLEEFLSDELCLSDPAELADMEKAAAILNKAIEEKSKTAVFGDYDCDGLSATAVMYRYLCGRGADCVYYIPDRLDEGYGMNTAAVEKLAADGVKLIVTVDNGIAAAKEVALAEKLGMTVIVTDHHLPGDVLPNAAAVVDPHRRDCRSGFKELCGAQVAFSLICAAEGCEPEELLPEYADILSLAVTADVMPLVLENRGILKAGVNKLKSNPAPGLAALMRVAGINAESLSAERIAFGLAPRINAAGRLGKAETALRLLITEDAAEAAALAEAADRLNNERKDTEKRIFEEAIRTAEADKSIYNRIIVVSGKNWHRGVLGIVASRLTERCGRPSIVISEDGRTACGSARSIEGFSIFEALSAAADTLIRFGGHTLAAGITLKTECIADFRKKINEYADNLPRVAPVLRLDCRLKPSALSLDLAESLKLLEPYGKGNPVPIFGLFGVTLTGITPIGHGKHLRLIFTKGECSFQAVLFGVTPAALCFKIGDVLDAAVTLEASVYAGENRLTVQIKALRMSGTDDDRLFAELDAYESFLAGNGFNAERLLPERHEVGEVYRAVAAEQMSAERIKYLMLSGIGYAKAAISVTVLSELGLIAADKNGIYRETGRRNELKNSPTYRLLSEGGAVK